MRRELCANLTVRKTTKFGRTLEGKVCPESPALAFRSGDDQVSSASGGEVLRRALCASRPLDSDEHVRPGFGGESLRRALRAKVSDEKIFIFSGVRLEPLTGG